MKGKMTVLIMTYCICFTACQSQQKQPAAQPNTDTIYTYKNASADGIGKFYFGREIAHVMGAAGSDWLERGDRNKEENTNLAIAKINLPANGIVADIGAGTGYYSFKLSAKVPKGKVYAVEVQDEMIAYLNNKKVALQDTIVKIVKGTGLSPNLPLNSVDLVIMVDVYHELQYPHEMLQAISKSLKPDGKILLIEYRGEDASVPIKPLHKITIVQVTEELNANGFSLTEDGEFLPIQHYLLFSKRRL